MPVDLLANHTDGLIALSGCRKGEIAASLLHGNHEQALEAARRYRDWFGAERFWIELQHHQLADDDALVCDLVELAQHLHLGTVATNNVHYAEQSQHSLQDILVCIRHNTQLDEAEHLLRPNSENDLKDGQAMRRLFRTFPDALTNTVRIAEQCQFALHFGLQELPAFRTPSGSSALHYLQSLCEHALQLRYPPPASTIHDRLRYEVKVIERGGLANYFLIVWDIVRFARERYIRCQGRGSAANSLVAYLLDISPVDPLAHDLVFERFLSDERCMMPDIDIDFDAARREEVIQYIYQRYGHDHAAMACTLVTFRTRSAIRDVGKALGLPMMIVERLAKDLSLYGLEYVRQMPDYVPFLGNGVPSSLWQHLLDCADAIKHVPRHLGIHNGGMVITGQALATRVPTEPATMTDRFVVQWDKDSLEDAGLIKIDILGLRMLSAVSEAVEVIGEVTGKQPDIDHLTFDDPHVFEMITATDTIGVFQVESGAQTSMLPFFRPRIFEDLIIAISLIRPGPIQGEMVHPYIRRRSGEEQVTYLHELLKPALGETLGVILFQEQVLKVARDLAGFTAGQGELLRRALGNKNATAAIAGFHDAFVAGALAQNVEEAIAEQVFEKLLAFGGYSFPKSHAAAFAVLVYQSAWMKVHHPQAFYVGLLNNQPMGYWSPAIIVNDIKRHGIKVLPVDVNRSQARCHVERDNIRLGFNYISGFSDVLAKHIAESRQTKRFTNLTDFCRRTRLPRRKVENLILAGAMDVWRIPRRDLIWQLGTIDNREDTLDLAYTSDGVTLPELPETEARTREFQVLGVSLHEHIMTHHRDWLSQRGFLTSRDLFLCVDNQRVRVAGLVADHRSPQTAKGVHFLKLEDESGLMNVIVFPNVYTRHQRVLREENLLMFEGRVQRRAAVVNVIAERARTMK